MRLHINDWISEGDSARDGGTGGAGDVAAAGGAGGAGVGDAAIGGAAAGGAHSELTDFIAQTGTKVLAMLGQEHDEVGVTLVTDADIRQMNLEHRGIDAPTDVLSFALDDETDGDSADEPDQFIFAFDEEDASDDRPHLVGDIVISVERAEAQSKEYGHSLQREIGFLLIHGLLHLYGYDHIDEQDRIDMRAEEERILAVLGLGRDIPETPHTS